MMGHGSTLMLEKVYANLDAEDVGMLVEARLSAHEAKVGAEDRHNRGTAATPTEARGNENIKELPH